MGFRAARNRQQIIERKADSLIKQEN